MHQSRKTRKQQEQYLDVIDEIFSEIEKDINNDPFYSENRKDKLCIIIRDIMIKEKVYRNPMLTRDSLIKHLGTNKSLFVETFQYCFGMPFRVFINKLRLKEAIILLEQSDLPIEEIAEKAGFGTVRTFQRQFMAKYNMSPNDYRKSITE